MSKPKILIIDDEAGVRQALQVAFKHENYQLAFAENGKIGLEQLESFKADLVFLDLRMPVMDGYGFLEAVGLNKDTPFTVIVVTGHGEDMEIERCFKLGIDFFLRKPLSLMEVCCLARRCIEMKQLERDKNRLVAELEEALCAIRQLKSFLLVCASCRRVKDDDEGWQSMDHYLHQQTGTRISHGVCPDCARKLYPEFYNPDRQEPGNK